MRLKIVLSILLLLLVVVFTLQNTDIVNIKFLFWEYTISRALVLLLVLAVGLLVGLFLAGLPKCRNQSETTIGLEKENP